MKATFISLVACILLLSCNPATRTIIVGPKQISCNTSNNKTCYQVKKDSLEDWKSFSGAIKGFNYKPGFTYVLEVEEINNETKPNLVANYTLKRILKKQQVISQTPVGSYWVKVFKDRLVVEEGMTLNFTRAGQVNGKGVCNRYSGTFTATKQSKIKFSQVATTKILCKEADLERDFFQSMSAINKYIIEKDSLKLMENDKIVLAATLKTK